MYLNKISLFFTLIIIVSNVNSGYSDTNVPVFVWGSSSLLSSTPSSSPLEHLGKEQFSKELDDLVKKDVSVVLFVEDKLSPEDFQCTVNDMSCFKNLLNAQSSNEFLYYPSVEAPVEVLQSKSNVEVVNFVNKGTSEDRQHLLSQHDEFMQEKLDSLRKSNKEFVAVFTAKAPSLNIQPNHRVARQTEVAKDDVLRPNVFNVSGVVLLTITNFTLYNKEHEKGMVLNLNSAKLDSNNSDDSPIKIYDVSVSDGTYTLKMKFTGKSGYWSVTNIEFVTKTDSYQMRTPVDIAGTNGFSFHCHPTTKLIPLKPDDSLTLATFVQLQVQPFFGVEAKRFGDSLDCVGFMSAPILSGLFVTFMLAAIIALGICMMMDLKTMDRFEDPKGKTITVTATD